MIEQVEGAPRWPFAAMRIYAGAMMLGAAAVQFSQPHGLLVGSLELLVGIALACGFVTRAAAVLAIGIVVANILPIHGVDILVSPGPRTALVMLLVTVALGRGGQVLGVDAALARRHPGNPLW